MPQSEPHLSLADLASLAGECKSVVREICGSVADQEVLVVANRELVVANDVPEGLRRLQTSRPDVADRILTAAVGVLVNSVNAIGIESEVER